MTEASVAPEQPPEPQGPTAPSRAPEAVALVCHSIQANQLTFGIAGSVSLGGCEWY